MNKKSWIIILVALFLIAYSMRPEKSETINIVEPDTWPTEEWPVSTPEEQGMDSEKLVELFEYVEQYNPENLHGLLIIRNGHIIVEKYGSTYNKDKPHEIYSVTKSLTGAIAGVALEEGIISSDDKVLDFFPDMSFENMSEDKQNITIEQLLTMKTGIDWPELQEGITRDWEQSDNQLKYYLDRPIRDDQIGKFNFDTGAVVTLGAILEQELGMELTDYAEKKIFSKIGIESLEWRKTNEGTTNGGNYALMTPRDMARFGFLYLQNGKWDEEQIIPEEWVKTSTSPHRGKKSLGYGYYFWLTLKQDRYLYYANGEQSQYIYIIPKENLIVVQTANDYEVDLLSKYILPAVMDDKPIPENPKANARLKELTDGL